MEPWSLGAMEPWSLGAMEPWSHGAIEPSSRTSGYFHFTFIESDADSQSCLFCSETSTLVILAKSEIKLKL
jgi:hypothetical protein